jgi:membrane-associated protein
LDQIVFLFDFILHVDEHLREFAMLHGAWIYGLLFLIVFLETGVVVTPLLPGDSLLFAAGALAAAGVMDLMTILLLLNLAAVAGDNMNYWIGRFLGPKVFTENRRFLNRKYLLRTQAFYEKHGGKAVIMARFVPIVRTFAPFVAGIGRMHYPRFLAFDIGGGVLWVWSFGLLGFFFGEHPVVEENFGIVILAIIGLSLVPVIIELWRARRRGSDAVG